MTGPAEQEILAALEATWPAARSFSVGPWTIRDGDSGGKRVSAATADGNFEPDDIMRAEQAMSDLNQSALFMIRTGDTRLDQHLARRGYRVLDPVSLYACKIGSLTGDPVDPGSVQTLWPPNESLKNLWFDGGIDAGRLRVMQRASAPKSAILVRNAGGAFVSLHRTIAMIHAIEVAGAHRRRGYGINILHSAVQWAQDHGAIYLSLAVTDANVAANGLYNKLEMSVVGKYHYRIRR